MNHDEIDENGRQFLIRLFEQTNGDPSTQVSMYDVGELLGFDRNTSSRVAETLIGLQLIEIRTLSGGIAISAQGIEAIQRLGGGASGAGSGIANLGNDRILDEAGTQSVEQVIAELKNQVSSLGLDFDTLTELMADLKTMDAQLGSSRTKTAIVRECLRSIKAVLETVDGGESLRQIKVLLGES